MAAPLLGLLARGAAGSAVKGSAAKDLSGIGVNMSVDSNISKVMRSLNNIQREQLPFAIALAMTRTVEGLEREEKKQLRSTLHKPTAYTKSFLAKKTANKKDRPINASVFFREFAGKGTPASKYLTPNIKGGRRGQKRHEIALSAKVGRKIYTGPAKDAPLNSAGNLTAGYYTKILSQVQAFGESGYRANAKRRGSQGFYIASKGGVAVGIRQRVGDQSKKILNFMDNPPTYKKRYPFYEAGNKYVRDNIGKNFKSAYRRAIKTAR